MKRRRYASDLVMLLVLVAVGSAFFRPAPTKPQPTATPGQAGQKASPSYRGHGEATRAIEEYAAGHYEKSLEWCSKALEVNPDLLAAYRYRARCQLALGHNEQARASLDYAIQRATCVWDWLLYSRSLALLYLDRARLNLAEKRYLEAEQDVAKSKDHEHLWAEDVSDVEARALSGQGKWADALLVADRADDNDLAQRHLALLQHHEGQPTDLEELTEVASEPHESSCPICAYGRKAGLIP